MTGGNSGRVAFLYQKVKRNVLLLIHFSGTNAETHIVENDMYYAEHKRDFILDGILYLDNRQTVVFGGKTLVPTADVLELLAELGSTRNTADVVGALPHEMILFLDHQAVWQNKTWQEILGGERKQPKTFWKHPDFNTTVLDTGCQLTLVPHPPVIEVFLDDSQFELAIPTYLNFSQQATLIPEKSSNAHLVHRQEVAVQHHGKWADCDDEDIPF